MIAVCEDVQAFCLDVDEARYGSGDIGYRRDGMSVKYFSGTGFSSAP